MHNGYAVWVSQGGKQAIKHFKDRKPDMVVIDFALPERLGMELCNAIREQSGVPIIILSEKADEDSGQ